MDYNSQGKIDDMKKMTISSGLLCPAQIKNLTYYPFIVIDPRQKSDVAMQYDLLINFKEENLKNRGIIKYYVTSSEEVIFNDKMYDAVEKCITFLLWSGINIIFYFNGKELWNNQKKKQ